MFLSQHLIANHKFSSAISSLLHIFYTTIYNRHSTTNGQALPGLHGITAGEGRGQGRRSPTQTDGAREKDGGKEAEVEAKGATAPGNPHPHGSSGNGTPGAALHLCSATTTA